MGLESIFMQMGQNMKVNGSKTSSMGRVRSLGQMELPMSANILMVKRIGKENSSGQMELVMRGTFMRILSMVPDIIDGLTVEHTTANGKKTLWMEKEHLLGLMVGSMQVNLSMGTKRATEFLPGLMVVLMKVAGRMESSTEKVFTNQLQGKQEKASGIMVNESVG